MRKLFSTVLVTFVALGVSGQDNMEPLRHLSLGVEAGLHGFGVELAVPVQKHIVFKAGYNWVPSGDLVNTNINIDTEELKNTQEQYDPILHFQNKFGDEAVINAGLQMGLTNYKAMINWYPFVSGRFYLAGGVYYTPSGKQDEPFLKISGNTTENDWAALQELRQKTGNEDYDISLTIGEEKYPVVEKDGCGYMEADFMMDPLKYYVGMGLGRCVPNKIVGLQFELGAMIYHNSVLYCQDREVGSIIDAAEGLGNDAKEILEYVDKYPIYPQLTLRLSFRMF